MGRDALGEAMVRVQIGETIYSGIGTSPDVIEASARAYLNAYNRYFANGGAKMIQRPAADAGPTAEIVKTGAD
jgi:hypothetical protein